MTKDPHSSYFTRPGCPGCQKDVAERGQYCSETCRTKHVGHMVMERDELDTKITIAKEAQLTPSARPSVKARAD